MVIRKAELISLSAIILCKVELDHATMSLEDLDLSSKIYLLVYSWGPWAVEIEKCWPCGFSKISLERCGPANPLCFGQLTWNIGLKGQHMVDQKPWICVPLLPLISLVILIKSLNPFWHQFSYLQNGKYLIALISLKVLWYENSYINNPLVKHPQLI